VNAIARALTNTVGINLRPIFIPFANLNKRMFFLFLAIIFSALGVLYSKDFNRRSFINYQNAVQIGNKLQTDYGKLLLERSTWTAQERIQRIAENNLGMQMPNPTEIVVLKL
jgi:cell division protein FtsL